ncbi:MAG: hypothetical protein KDD47_22190, partial [Acidobacteria bacterium]|nr:hypothetical protein [Acidobacteriota bacterium]
MSESVPTTIACYRVVEEIGRVPEGRGYRAVDTRSGAPVLLKILDQPAESEGDAWRVSLDRTRRLGRMSHPSLPILYQIGSSPAGPFVAFSPPSGVPLRQFVSEGGRVDRQRLVEWSSQLLGLLAEAHSEGLLHGHLGVDSVFVADDGSLSLTGFGLTRLLPDTPEVQSPEQKRGEVISPSSDLYSLAALMKRLGAAVEMGGASTEPLAADDPLLQVLNRATAENPRDRYANASDMDLALREEARDDPSGAPSTASPSRPSRESSILGSSDPALSTVMIDPSQLAELKSSLREPAMPPPTVTEAEDQEAPPPRPRRPPARPEPTPSKPTAARPEGVPAAGAAAAAQKSRRWGLWVAVLALLVLGGGFLFLTRSPWNPLAGIAENEALPADSTSEAEATAPSEGSPSQ